MNTFHRQPPPVPGSSNSAATGSADNTAANSISRPAVEESFAAARDSMNRLLVGHHRLIERLLAAVITGGHVLIEGSPGLAKARTVNTFAKVLNADFVRIQATPDLLPADLTGTNVYQQHDGCFNFVRGPLFNNVVLVDEINRASPRTQSALLEAMAERQVTIEVIRLQLLVLPIIMLIGRLLIRVLIRTETIVTMEQVMIAFLPKESQASSLTKWDRCPAENN